jgi:16S rRNA (guanine527-N7)-methyltransferase
MGANTGHLGLLSPFEIEDAVAPMLLQPLPSQAYPLLAHYLELLSHWNQKINLTAVRDSEVLVRLHFGECLRAAQRIPAAVETVLDFGSGAGLPGIPIQIARPEMHVTLAESQKKKAGFLREVVRELALTNATVQSGRVEEMPKPAVFDLVVLRAVDKMGDALLNAIPRMRAAGDGLGGGCMMLTSRTEVENITSAQSAVRDNDTGSIQWTLPESIPGTDQRVILLGWRE